MFNFFRFSTVVFVLSVVNSSLLVAAIPDLSATSDYVFDGDTFSAKVGLENSILITVRVRIRNIDAPEIHGECQEEIDLANMAKHRLAALLPKGTKVKLSEIKDDKYLGRIDAKVQLDGQDVGKMMIDGKLARRYSGGRRESWCKKQSDQHK